MNPIVNCVAYADGRRIKSVEIEGNNIIGKNLDGNTISTYNPNDLWVVGDLMKYGVKVEGKAGARYDFDIPWIERRLVAPFRTQGFGLWAMQRRAVWVTVSLVMALVGSVIVAGG